MFTEIEVKNFKGVGASGVLVRLGSLTILLGENNSGKTSVLEAIALLAQSAFQSGMVGFKWKGPWLDLGDGSSAWFRSDGDSWLTIGVGFQRGDDLNRWLQRNSPESDRHPLDFGYRVAHRGTTNEWRHEFLIGGHVQARNELLVTKRDFRTQSMTQELSLVGGSTFQPYASGGSILAPELFTGSSKEVGTPIAPENVALMNESALLAQYLRETLPKHVFFVGADRGPKEEAPEQMSQADLSVGRKGEHTLSVLSLLFASSQYAKQSDRIQHWAQEFGMPQLRGGFTREPILKAGYVDAASQAPLRLESAGFGSQQILPVIVQLFSAPPHSLIMIEEPEISLHPAAQVSLVRMFSEAVASGQQVIITTHSQTLLLALSEASKVHSMSPTDIAIYHMARGPEGAKTTRLAVDSNWSLKGWVPVFRRSRLNCSRSGLRTSMTTLPKKNGDILAVVDTQIFVPALASQPSEARFYACAIQKCWKFVFSAAIAEEYQRVVQKWGFRGDVIIHELNKLMAMNKYRTSEGDPDEVTDDLAPRKDRHIIAPCVYGHATVVVSNDRGIQARKIQIRVKTGAHVVTMAEAEKLLSAMPDCHSNPSP